MAEPPGRLSFTGDGMDAPQERKAVFVDAKAMKEQLRKNMDKPKYDVTAYYKTEGCAQRVARDARFEHLTLGIIMFNALWIAVDIDANDEEVLHQAHPVFIIAENLFCLFFTVEISIRFAAFANKPDCLRDGWFVFDLLMVTLMIFETWLMTIILVIVGGDSGSGLGNASILRLMRLLRLSRMARMARLLRAMPELLILVKGMVAAVRSVFFTLVLLLLLVYVFAILYRQLTRDDNVGKERFPNLAIAATTLVMDGMFFDNPRDLAEALLDDKNYLGLFAFYLFVLLATLTVMNMLIGVLCEVVSAVATTEHEGLTIAYVRDRLQEIVNRTCKLDEVGSMNITKEMFVKILTDPKSAMLLSEVDVDVLAIVDLVDTIFATETGEERVLSFGDLVVTMMDQRDTNTATVKDITDMRKYVRGRLDKLEEESDDLFNAVGHVIEQKYNLPRGTFDSQTQVVLRQMEEQSAQSGQGQASKKSQKERAERAAKANEELAAEVIGRTVEAEEGQSPKDSSYVVKKRVVKKRAPDQTQAPAAEDDVNMPLVLARDDGPSAVMPAADG